jgi:hypothetical protein
MDENILGTARKQALHEQLRVVKRELGMEQDEKAVILEKFQKR